jgi:hypothetical protein
MHEHPHSPAHDAARRELEIADREADLAELERRAAKAAGTPRERAAHRLASEIHADVAASHGRAARRHELEAAVVEHGLS